MRNTDASSAFESWSSGSAPTDRRRPSIPAAMVRSTLRAASAAIESCARPTVRSTSARWRENESHPSSATGRTPVKARKAKRRVRNDIAADLREARRRCTRLPFDCRAALVGAAISRNGGKRAPLCAALLPALRMPRERQVLLQQALDPAHVLARARLPRAPHLVEDALAGEQHLAPGALARHQPREELQAAPAQVLGRLPNARFQHLDRRARIGLVLGPVIERLALLEAAQPGHGGGALEVAAHLLDRVLDPLRDHVQVLERLLQIIDRAQPERLDYRLGGSVAGHHDERAVRLRLAHAAEHLDAVHPRHVLVRQHAGDAALLEQLERLLCAGSGARAQALLAQDRRGNVSGFRHPRSTTRKLLFTHCRTARG